MLTILIMNTIMFKVENEYMLDLSLILDLSLVVFWLENDQCFFENEFTEHKVSQL